MFKRILFLTLILALAVTVCACGEEAKTLHCDNCGKAVTVEGDSNMDESWSIYCKECDEKLFSSHPALTDEK